MKAMNSSVIDSTRDMGLDGLQSNWHAVFPADVQGYTLGYFSGDYLAVGRNASGFKNYEMAYAGSGYNSDAASLYNGNIRSMMVHLSRFDTIGYAYRYDQLNRITRMNVWDNINMSTYAWNNGGNAIADYKERVSYDANGNILSYIRNGKSPVGMDSLTYNYYSGSNKLKYVDDVVAAGNYNIDIDDQSDSNYVYDKIGNLIADSSEGLAISWFVNGKVKQVVNSNTDTTVTFTYDPVGKRISKKVETNTDTITTFYVRDAQGNILADYSLRKDTIKWSEMAMYGSSRLGLQLPDTIVYPSAWTDTGRIQYPNYIGKKNYELTNHLGNVLSTINDWKVGTDSDTDMVVDYWQALLMSQQDYYPFGMLQPQRTFSLTDYRFSFQGQEHDDEIKGTGNSVNFSLRMDDPRLGRFFSIDPLLKKYPELSSYSFGGNQVIHTIELEGAEPLDYLGIGNHKGLIQSSNEYEYQTNTLKSAVKDASYLILLPLNLIDDYVVDLKDPDITTTKATADLLSNVSLSKVKISQPTSPKLTKTNAASTLPQMKGKSVSHIEKTLDKKGFEKAKVSKSGNQTWNHSDGSTVKVHPYGNKETTKYKSANNAHIHKVDPTGNNLNDRGIISKRPDETHIGIRNPKDLPEKTNRYHGQ